MNFKPKFINGGQQELRSLSMDKLLELVEHHSLLILRGFKAVTREELLAYFAKTALLHWPFGPVMEMQVDSAAKNYLFTSSDVPLHWDGAFHQEPRFLFFQCIQAPPPGTGGETFFVNTPMFWQNATEKQQHHWQDLSIVLKTEKLAHYGGNISCKLVQKHPLNALNILRFAEPVGRGYLNPVHVAFDEYDEFSSSQLLQYFSHHLRQPQFYYQHQWQDGDYLIADNFALLHGRNAFLRESPRHLRRIQIL